MIKETIKKEMELRGDKMSDIAKAVDVQHPTIAYWFRDERSLRLEVLEKICTHYNLVLTKKEE